MTSDLLPPLDESMAMIRGAWKQAVMLRAGRAMAEELVHVLERQYDNAGLVILEWHRDWYLVGCRRLIDDDRRTASLWRGLELLRRHAAKVDEQLVCERGVGNIDRDDVWTLEGTARERRQLLRRVVERGGSRYEGRLTKAAVATDQELLTDRSTRIVRFVNELIVHRARDVRPNELTFDDIYGFVDLVFDVTQRWTAILDGVHLDDQTVELRGVRPMAMALSLFDWREFVEAQAEAEIELGPAAPPEAYQQLRDNVRLRFEFGDS